MRATSIRRVLAGSAAALACRTAPAGAQFGVNLIGNGSAETSVGSPTCNDVVTVPSWVTTGGFTVVTYGAAGGFPTAASPGPATRGLNFFAGGPNNAASTATQSFAFADFAAFAGLPARVDAGTVRFTLAGFLGGFETQGDNATLTAAFLDGGAGLIGSVALGPVTSADRGGVTGLLARSATGVLPVGTRAVRFTLQMTRTDGSYNDGYADDLSFTLADAAVVPEPSTGALAAAGLAGAGALARRRRRARAA